jgi:hypothetical protein
LIVCSHTGRCRRIQLPGLEQNLHHKCGFVVPLVHLESKKNILMNAQCVGEDVRVLKLAESSMYRQLRTRFECLLALNLGLVVFSPLGFVLCICGYTYVFVYCVAMGNWWLC